MFSFYAAPAEPFLVLAVVYVLGAIITPAGRARPARPADRRRARSRPTAGWSAAVVAGAYVLLVALCFAYFYPIFVGRVAAVRRVVGADVAGRPLDLRTAGTRRAPRAARRVHENGPARGGVRARST